MGCSGGEGSGGAQEHSVARGKFSKIGCKTGPFSAIRASCEGTLEFSFVYWIKIQVLD